MRHSYSQKELEDIRKRFPNVNDDEFRVEADRILKDQMNLWVMNVDWEDPDPGDVERLRALLGSKSLDEVADRCSGGDWEGFRASLEEFADSDDLSPEYLEENGALIAKIGEFLADDPFCGDDFVSIERRHTISAVMSFGGPGSSVDFTLDSDGELLGATASYSWGFKSHKIELDYETAEKLWNNFSHISDEIGMSESARHRNGPRM